MKRFILFITLFVCTFNAKAEQRKELKEVFNLTPQQLTFILWGLK